MQINIAMISKITQRALSVPRAHVANLLTLPIAPMELESALSITFSAPARANFSNLWRTLDRTPTVKIYCLVSKMGTLDFAKVHASRNS